MSEHILSDEQTFWTHNYAQQAPRFDEQVASLAEQPRDNLLISSPLDINSEHDWITCTEGDAMRSLATFISEASALLKSAGGRRAQDAQEFLRAMQKRFFFLGTPEYKQSCQGIASNWEQHLETCPDSVINVYGPSEPTTQRAHSYNKVPLDIVECVSPALRERVITNPADWQTTEHAKLVAVDDWVISGATASRIASNAIFNALGHGKAALTKQLELHLLAAAPNQLGTQLVHLHSREQVFPGTVRSYFVTAPAERIAMNHWGMLVSGAHSSTDYALEMPIGHVRTLLKDQGQPLELPRLTYLQRSYR
ncbi:MAG TPA: hypothetical protein VLG11_04050 [Candidatus Saccharimonadales bacterium]|nr:hypothetical protein [Candidatus Saccharimonadales bacterium]